jgi:pimeloyl-ACP methyl ester carboxylesterase
MRKDLIATIIVLPMLSACGSTGSPVPASPSSAADASSEVPSDEISTTEIAVGELVFHARVSGPQSGELVILLHGFPETSYEWRAQLRALARKGYRAIAPDQRGYSPGARPGRIEDYSVPKLASDVTDIADSLGAGKFHLVGHDWGASIAWAVAALAPDRVLSLTTMSVPHPDAFIEQLQDKTSCQYAASLYFDFFTSAAATDYFVNDDFSNLRAIYEGVPTEDVDVYVQELGSRETIDAALDWYRANVANREVSDARLGKTKVPTLFIWSDGDTALCREGGEQTHNFVDAPYRFEIIPGVNHWLVDNAPDQVTRLLLDQVASYSAAN